MTIDLFTSSGTKKGTLTLPESLFGVTVKHGLIHQMLVLQQSNARRPIAHAKRRGEVIGSTKKLFQQKGTGRARRGDIRSPLLRGGGKAFGPRKDMNFEKKMPRGMRHAALRACLSLQAKNATILGLEDYPGTIKTKNVSELLTKMNVQIGRNTLIVLPAAHEALTLSSRNIPKVKTVTASYLNPQDVLKSRFIIFLVDALKVAEDMFGSEKERKIGRGGVSKEVPEKKEKKEKAPKVKKTAKPKAAKKAPSKEPKPKPEPEPEPQS